MSQKERKFQSKDRPRGGKFQGKGKSFGGRFDRPEKKRFDQRSEGDRGFRRDREEGKDNGADNRERRFDRPQNRDRFDSRPRREGGKPSFGGKPRFGSKPRFDREDRNGTEDRPRREGGRPSFGDKKPRFDRDNRSGGGSRPSFSRDRNRNRPRRDDRPRDRDFTPREPVSPETQKKLKSDRPNYGAPSPAFLFGVHAVTQALLNPARENRRLLCTAKGLEAMEDTLAAATAKNLSLPDVLTVEHEDIERLLPRDAVHQGVLLDCKPLEEVFLTDVLISMPEDAKVLVLDQVTDPHNIGAILRSAAAFGVSAIIMQKLHAPDVTGTLAKSASGAVEHVPMVREVNLSRALEQLKEAGFFCIGLDEEGKRPLSALGLDASGKIAIVLGAEGSGLRRLVGENCNELAKLQTQGPIGSLNVSNAAAIALYELVRN